MTFSVSDKPADYVVRSQSHINKWPIFSLGELCQIIGGGTPSKKNPGFYSGNIPWVTVKDFGDTVIRDTIDHITEDAVERSATNLVPAGTVLVVTRVGLGKVAITGRDMAINQDIKALFPDERVLPEYLFWFLVSKSEEIERMGTGATVKGITLKQLKSLSVPLPSHTEQCRIVDILNRADSIRRLRKQAIDTARQLIPALFIDMFGDPATNPKGWVVKSLREVADIGSGVTKGRKLGGQHTVELPYLAVSNVQDGYLDLTKIKSIRVKPDEIEKYRVLPGDFLMTEGGDPDKLGRGAIWNGELDVCLHQNHVFRVRCDPDRLLPEYLRSLVGSHYGKGYFLKVAKQTTGIASINKTQLGNFPVLVAPMREQRNFRNKLVDIESTLEQLRKAMVSICRLQNSLLHSLFSSIKQGKC